MADTPHRPDPVADDGPPGPSADDLTDRQVAAIVAACDQTRLLRAELAARGPGGASTPDQVEESKATVRPVVDAFMAAGLSEKRAYRALTVWLIEHRDDPRYCVREADATRWRQPGDAPGGLGQPVARGPQGTGSGPVTPP